ncbi:hypothetical protein K501DRAFT_231328 [Backusella circina FSU 941]|nr:hypothetical protein K501DRAFT_231328 [Backusella circina FSU 941]
MTIRKTKKKVEKQLSSQEPDWVDEMNQAIDSLSENRTSIREEALKTMIKSFSNHLVSAHIENRLEMILGLLKRSITKYGSSKEACLAAQTVNLVFMHITEEVSETDQDDLYRRILPCLKLTVKESDDIELKIKCLKTLGLITYTSASDIDKQLVRDYIFDLIETDGIDFNTEALQPHDCDRFLAEALCCYGILFAASFSQGVVSFDAVWSEVEKVMPIHEIMLESSDNSVRIASGENIGLIFETIRLFTKDDGDNNDSTTTRLEYDNMDGLIHTLKNLSIESSRYKGKSERVEQKSVFREVFKSVEQNERPKEDLKIGNRTLVFKGWAKILVLNAFRKSLGQGLQFHLKSNSLVKDIFRYSFISDDDDSEKYDILALSNVDKHYIYDENKKARSKYLRGARLGKENQEFKVA